MNTQQKTHKRNRRYNRRNGLCKLQGIELRAQNKLSAKRASDERGRKLESERGGFVHVAHRFTASLSGLCARRGMMTPRKARKLRDESRASLQGKISTGVPAIDNIPDISEMYADVPS